MNRPLQHYKKVQPTSVLVTSDHISQFGVIRTKLLRESLITSSSITEKNKKKEKGRKKGVPNYNFVAIKIILIWLYIPGAGSLE